MNASASVDSQIPSTFDYRSNRAQEIIILLLALDQKHGAASKHGVLRCIVSNDWYAIGSDDFDTVGNAREFAWENRIARARQDAISLGLLCAKVHWDCWRISEKGSRFLVAAKERFATKVWYVGACDRFSDGLKAFICPGYQPFDFSQLLMADS